jgi:hypothetical protein
MLMSRSAAVAEQPRRIQTQLQVPDLPNSVEELLEQYKWQDNASRRHNLSIMWDDVAQEQRMAAVLGSSFDNGDETARRGISREKGVIRGLLKVCRISYKLICRPYFRRTKTTIMLPSQNSSYRGTALRTKSTQNWPR